MEQVMIKPDTVLKEVIFDTYFEGKEEVSLDDIIQVFIDEFPELLLVIAEENFFRGYQQGLEDKKIEDILDDCRKVHM